MNNITKENILIINIAGDSNFVKCRICGGSVSFRPSYEQPPITVEGTVTGRKGVLRKPQDIIKNFQELHFGRHKAEQKRRH